MMNRRTFLKRGAAFTGALAVVGLAHPIVAQVIAEPTTKTRWWIESIERIPKQRNTYLVQFGVQSAVTGPYRDHLDITITPTVRSIQKDGNGDLVLANGNIVKNDDALVESTTVYKWAYVETSVDAYQKILQRVETIIINNDRKRVAGSLDGTKSGNGKHLWDSKFLREIS